MSTYRFFDSLMLRAPAYSFARYLPDRLPGVLLLREFQQALLLASPGFYGIVAAKNFEYERLKEKERFTLLKYYNRICFRPTPFGAFAGFGMTSWGDGAARLAAERKLHLYPDREELFSSDSTGRIGLSPLVYLTGKEYRIIRKELAEGQSKFSFRLDAVRAERLTKELVALLAKGPKTFEEVVAWVSDRTGADRREASDLLDYFLEIELLLRDRPNDTLIIGNEFDWSGPSISADPAKRYYSASEIQVSGGPSDADRTELERCVRVLQKMSAAASLADGRLSRFCAAFTSRFGDRQVPLLTALDPDAGITYEQTEETKVTAWNTLHRLFLKSWIQNTNRGYYDPVTLTDQELGQLEMSDVRFSPTIGMFFRKTGGQLLIEHAGGATGTSLTGRFSVFSGDAHQFCREIALKEQALNPDVDFADINGQSGLHVDNINLRKRIFDYEITLSTCCDSSVSSQLLPADLLLYQHRGELQLFSVNSGKRVIPRLATAFNAQHSGLAIFRFLADLQYQGLSTNLNLDIQSLFPDLLFYPRICYSNCVLSPAKWVLKPSELPGDPAGLTAFRRTVSLPQHISFGRGDQQMVYDLAAPDDARFFLHSISGETVVVIHEYLVPDASVREGNREMAGQYMAALYHEENVYPPAPPLRVFAGRRIKRTFAPGGEWLYVKLYAAEASADRVLMELIAPFLKRYAAQYTLWFFVRYRDPEPHLRIRFKISTNQHGQLLAALGRALENAGTSGPVRYWYVDTYEREVERYHPALIIKAEKVFHAGSELVLNAIAAGNDETGLAVLTVIQMIAVFLPDPEDQTGFSSLSAEAFMEEFKLSKMESIAIDREYRELRSKLDGSVDNFDFKSLIKAMTSIHKSSIATGKGSANEFVV